MWPVAEFSLVAQINDFRRINLKADGVKVQKPEQSSANPANPASRTVSLSPPAMNELHLADREWLFGKLTEMLITNPDIETIIILSHFPLTRDGTSDPQYSGQKQAINNYYANEYHNDLMAITSSWCNYTNEVNLGKKQIFSISGHTHFAYDFMRDDVRYINSGAWGFHLQ